MRGYAEYGPAGELPLFLFHGAPGCRLAVPEMWPGDPPAVRVIAPDRPGIGSSTFQPGRRLTDWAYPGEGHLIVPAHWDDILGALLSAEAHPA